jgi:pyruvate dehydrogenase E1 component alpha subunit
VAELFSAGKLPGFVHLYAGEEAIATGVCAHLTDRDYITSTHRGHGHCIATGPRVLARVRVAPCTSLTWTRECWAQMAS